MQYIVICLKDKTEQDPATYVQVTRKRFEYEEALKYASGVAPSRLAIVVPVPNAELNKKGYPIYNA